MTDKTEGKNGKGRGPEDGSYSFLRRTRADSPTSADAPIIGNGSRGSGRDGKSGGSGGDSGSESGSGGGERVAGASEPESGASGGDSGSGGDRGEPTADSRGGSGGIRSGRHNRACSCQRCRNRRAARGEPEPGAYTDDGTENGTQVRAERIRQGVPREVDFSAIFPGVATGQRIKVEDLFATGIYSLYKLPVIMGYGEHWELAKEESKQLGSALKTALETLPEERVKKWVKRGERILPWFSLIAIAGILTYPRVQLTREMVRKERHAKVFNIDGTPREPARPVSVEGANASGPPDQPVSRDGAKQPGHTYSGGKDIPLDFVIPD